MDWWEEWLGSIVGQDNVFPVTWLLSAVLALVVLYVLIVPRRPK